jgi:hypothetical protein
VTDRRPLSRRQLLWATATIGAAASTGGGAAAVMSDAERASGTLTAGILELESVWGNAGGTDDPTHISISDPEGSEQITVDVSGNPSYVWFRTQCAQCTPGEEELEVRFGLDTDGDGNPDQWLDGFGGGQYRTLRAARELLGEGVLLGELAPDETWHLVVDWRTGTTPTAIDDAFDFGFYATQTRHVMNASRVAPAWECDVDCSTGGGTGDESDLPAISWVAFCGDGTFDPDFRPERSADERTLLLETDSYTVPDSVVEIAVKYGQYLDVFQYDGQTSITVGDPAAETFEHTGGNQYDGTDRNNTNFCAGSGGCKFEFPDTWECTGWGSSGDGGPPSNPGGGPPSSLDGPANPGGDPQ